MTYDLLKEAKQFITEFDTKGVDIIGGMNKKKGSKYNYSQKELIRQIDLATLSQFETSHFDPDGKRKLYLNIVNFFVDVADKSTDIDTRNFIFVPEGLDKGNRWATWLFSRQFKYYVKDVGLAKVINEVGHNFNKYGSVVLKKYVEEGKTELEITPLQAIRNSQTACSLEEGIEGGDMVTVEHNYSYNQLKEYPEWDLPKRFKGKKEVQEVYALVPKSAIKGKGQGSIEDEYVLAMAVIIPGDNHVLFIEEIEELPFLEVHDTKVEGRWLAIGEVEKQLENQIAHNLAVNLHRRGMMWSAKKLFLGVGEVDKKNLATDVEDGDVIEAGANGDYKQIDTGSKSTAEYSQFLQVWGDNSQRKAFAFEAQTGEQMQSGTPFRLGAMMSNASQGYFDVKKEKLGLFWKNVFWAFIVPDFKKSAKRDIEMISQTDDGYAQIKELFVELNTKQYFDDYFLSEDAFKYKQPTENEVRGIVEQELIKSPYIAVSNITSDLYKNAKFVIELDITGESVEPADKETMITLYQSLAQKGDPRADTVLEQVMSLMGKNMQAIAGKATTNQTPQNNQTATNPNLQGLVPQQ